MVYWSRKLYGVLWSIINVEDDVVDTYKELHFE